jgi:diguanylate cyclase (GGDEF)-like protein
MGFINSDEELNMDNIKLMFDSLLNSCVTACFIIDKSTFEILYQNQKAYDMVGDKLGRLCYQLFYTNDAPCTDCPMGYMGGTTAICTRQNELTDEMMKWQFSPVKWFDGRDVVLCKLMARGEEDDINNLAKCTCDNDKDSLTGLQNGMRFYTAAEHEFQENREKNYAVVVFDIDRFKGINDLYGMVNGDDALKHIAGSLRNVFGYGNNYARLRSDVFSFYMTYEKKGDIIKMIEKLRKEINANNFEFDINTSYGIYPVTDVFVPVNLMCDRAMMASRTTKGNILKFCAFYDEQYREDMIKANEIEHDMNSALENQDFKMYLQPKYRLDDYELCGAEVLCRWVHPKKGIIAPNDFIPLFEKNGFIIKLDEYMWEQACKALKGWIDEGRNPVPLSVNISRYHIGRNDIAGILTRLMEKYELKPDLLHLEITESLFLDKPETLNRELVKLQNIGFTLEVDDFGSGFSSLNLIRNISVDTIKIDKDFLDNEIASEKGKIVVNHTIDMAKDLKLQVIAEGVETKEHVDFLKNSHCDIAQGYYFAKPMPLEEFDKFQF